MHNPLTALNSRLAALYCRYDFCSEVPQLREAAEQYGLKRRGAAPKPAASAAEAEFNKAKGGGGGCPPAGPASAAPAHAE